MRVRDFTGRYPQQVRELYELIHRLSKYVKVPPVGLWNSEEEMVSPEVVAQIQKYHPDYDPDKSAGSYRHGVVGLFPSVLNFSSKLPPEINVMRRNHVLFHEVGHCIFERLLDKGQLDVGEFDRIRQADGWQQVSNCVKDNVKLYGFYHSRSREEDFADSFACTILSLSEFKDCADSFRFRYAPLALENFSEQFHNRFAFFQKLISQRPNP